MWSSPCEILVYSRTPFRTVHLAQERYQKISEHPLSTYLTWQDIPDDYLKGLPEAHSKKFGLPTTIRLKTVFPPANSCQVNIHGSELSSEIITKDIIVNDPDWTKKKVFQKDDPNSLEDFHLWTQCTSQDEEHYIYSLGLKDESLFIKVEILLEEKFNKTLNCQSAKS